MTSQVGGSQANNAGEMTAEAPHASSEADRALLRRFEPVMRYTRGERFFPTDVATYVRHCSLWMQAPDEDPVCLAPEGALTLDKLAEPRAHPFGTTYYLKFIEPLNIAALAAYMVKTRLAKKDPNQVFRAGRGRLSRVGYASRFVGALFSITLLARGRVPGDTAAAAALTYERMMAEAERYCYYARVLRLRQAGWVALQYWFFYPFNDWRSRFFGVNDHEADWEMICIYLSESDTGVVTPEWVAYASHEFSGDDLRRRWDDPEVVKVGEHPVVYVGAGSHASYYSHGEYLAEVELPFLSPLVRLVDRLQDFSRKVRRQTRGYASASSRVAQDSPSEAAGGSRPTFNLFRIPFVDYARGDGLAIGPGGDRAWSESVLLHQSLKWAWNYRGLWGLYARDPIAGENAPAGPVFNRDGMMRRSWYDPLGWAGLDKVPPPDEVLSVARERSAQITARRAALAADLAAKSRELMGLWVEADAMLGQPHLRRVHAAHQEKIAALSKELNQMRSQLTVDEALCQALELHATQVQAGERGPARAHIRRAHYPASDAGLPFSRFAETWAAVSIGLMMVGFVGLVLFARQYLTFGLVALLSLVIFVEAGFRRQLARLVTSVTVALAVVSALILLFEFFWQIVVFAVLVAGAYIMWENLRELRG